jgi:hypothetical protein
MTHLRSGFLIPSVIAGLASLVLAGSATQPTTRPYTLTTCVVSDEKLGGDMGEPVIYQHEGREIRFCCKGCIKDFKKAPAKYLKKLDDAEAAAPSTQPSGK